MPVLVLLCGFGATALATYLIQENLRVKERQRFLDVGSQIERTIQIRMETYSGLLRGGAGLFAANPVLTLRQFRDFYQRLQLEKRYPGVQGFGYSVQIAPDNLDALVARMRQEGLTNFTFWPPPNPPRDQYHSIVFLEPEDARNRQALGYDMFSDPDRRQAMEAARDTGEPQLTRKVRLVQEVNEYPGQAGFLLYLPVYLGGTIPTTIPERRSKLQGFIYCPFRANDLLGEILPASLFPEMAFAIWDGTNSTPETLLYQSDPRFRNDDPSHRSVINVSGNPWTIGISRLPGYGRTPGEPLLWMVPLAGMLVSGMLCYFTYLQGKAKARSEASASQLFNQREWLQVTLSSIADAVISTDRTARVQFMNAVAEELTGWKLDECRAKPLAEIFQIKSEDTGASAGNPAEQVLASGQAASLSNHTILTDRHGTERSIDDSAAPIRNWNGEVIGVVLVFREITEQRRYERRIAAQHGLTRILAESPSLTEAAGRVLEEICGHLKFELGVFWLFNHETGVARAFRIWHRADAPLTPFDQVCLDFHPRRGEGIPGLVWETQKPIWVNEFSTEKRFPRAARAQVLGIQTAFAFPVSSDSESFGALEFFSRGKSVPDPELLNVVQGLGGQVAQFIQRKNAERALAESEELYRAISETAADGIVVIDENSRILTVNHAVEHIFGYDRAELIGSSLKKLMPARMHGRHEQGLRHFLETGRKRIPWTGVELPGLKKNGQEVPLEISFGAAMRDGQHLFTGLLRDISPRKEAERKLRETEERFALLVRLAEEYAVITMGPEGEVTTWNLGAERIFGYSDEEVMGRDVAVFFTEEDQKSGLPAMQLRKAEAEGQVLDERWQTRKDGSRFWASGSLMCLRTEDGNVRGFAKILRDITERKRAEESVRELNQELEIRVQRRTAALQESKEQMEAFSYTVAHDLRAPLRAMQGFAHALLDDYSKHLDAPAADYLRRIMDGAQRMDELIQDLLSFSQLSRSDFNVRAVPVTEAVRNALQPFEAEIKARQAEVRLDLDPLLVKAHPSTLEQVISNLISNGLKFAPAGQPARLHIRAIDQGDRVQISVQDNGIGIAPEHHDRIFRVFERLHEQNAFPGTGIGLAIVKKGVERMGGKVGLASEPGQGSLFWIELAKANPEFANGATA